MGSPSPGKRVLLITNSEHGQANVYLATSYALVTLEDEDVEVHFASFPPIEKFVNLTTKHAVRDNSRARPIIFHSIDGIDMVSAWTRPELVSEQEALKDIDVVKLVYAIRRMMLLLKIILPWTGPEFVKILFSVIDIVHKVQPDIIAVDPAFSPALTALRHINAKFIVLSPNTIKDFAMPHQPNGEPLWKYPCIGTYFPFPVPLAHIPTNIFLVLLAIVLAAFFDSHRRSIQRHVAAHVPGARLTTLNDLSLNAHLGIRFLVANLPEIEFPLAVTPPSIIPCGPMIRPALSLAEVDPALAVWLRQAPTVYVNLGTHMFLDEDMAVEMAVALRIALDAVVAILWRDKKLKGLQVLWKLNRKGEYEVGKKGCKVWDVLGERMMLSGRVKVVEWFEAEPTAVLEGGRVVCAVHHGGANSFLETVSAGIPQVIIPVWMDTYDFARRAEILGIGRWGNQGTEFGTIFKGRELGTALVDVLIGGRASVYENRARELADLCKRSGGGRVIAARRILAEIETDDASEGEKT
ncbi:hypothetical protein B0T14DRAFT_546357 [Immersiella caudata]|uniref:Uncharacterized protein n=1 Tax=Immersiella caudata TaxID=314043 RepID=A0AA40C0H8_9PEZI|nr:hypothetical protein B0T14DRAFT_546357 [Immersiella caudata]